MSNKTDKSPQGSPDETLTTLGMEMERDLGASDLTIRSQLNQLMDNVASTIPEKLSKEFYKEAKGEADVLVEEHSGTHDTGVFRLALRKFSNIANRLVRSGGK